MDHANVRADKTDCFPPQPELIDMLNGLYEKSKSFVPDFSSPKSVPMGSPKDLDPPRLTENYALDLDVRETQYQD